MDGLTRALAAAADPADAVALARYFQVRPGGYGEGDVFLGVRSGPLRAIARPYARARFDPEVWVPHLRHPLHEHRLVTLMVMADRVVRCRRSAEHAEAELIVRTYLDHTDRINAWDLVDVSCGPVIGGHLLVDGTDPARELLDRLAGSAWWWERRIAIVSTFELIRAGETAPTYRLAERLADDPHDLLHKATGWMLREAGKRVCADELRNWLTGHGHRLHRTALRYAIERFDPAERQHWLAVTRR